MEKVIKQAAGIDVSKNELVVSFSRMIGDCTIEHLSNRKFANNQKGFEAFLKASEKIFSLDLPVHYSMEATGVYYESLAYFLKDADLKVSVVLPSKIANFLKTTEVKTITDKTCSETIARFILERKLEEWTPPRAVYRSLKGLSRERAQVVEERTEIKNKLHAEHSEAFPSEKTIGRLKQRIALLGKQEKEIIKEITLLLSKDAEVKQHVELVCTIKGISLISAVTVLSETNGFSLIRNKKQLVSYAGLDVKEKTSGTSVKGKPVISKKGNKHLRKAMHLPALCAIRYDQRMKNIFIRLVSKHGIKMKAVVAVQRKLLELIYTIWKTNKPYNPNYLDTIVTEKLEQS